MPGRGGGKKLRGPEAELAALVELCRGADDAGLREPLARALATGHALVAARAAREARVRGLAGLIPDLVACYRRFVEDGATRDPGCRAKEAAIEALAVLEHPDPEPFLAAARGEQPEPAFGGPVDTAGAVRARAMAALAAMAHPEVLIVAGDMLGDPDPGARRAAAECLAHHGDPLGAGSLLQAVRRGDEDLGVLAACLGGALRLAPAAALPRARALVRDPDPEIREAAAVALGTCPAEAAAAVLAGELEDAVLADGRLPILRALALHRSERALDLLAAAVAEGALADAREAIRALAARRDEARVVERIRAAVLQRGEAALEDELAEAFGVRGP